MQTRYEFLLRHDMDHCTKDEERERGRRGTQHSFCPRSSGPSGAAVNVVLHLLTVAILQTLEGSLA